jgi:hypothetical protein
MTEKFRKDFTFRDGSNVDVQVQYEQGIAGKMTERLALERAAQIIGDRLEELGEPDEGD